MRIKVAFRRTSRSPWSTDPACGRREDELGKASECTSLGGWARGTCQLGTRAQGGSSRAMCVRSALPLNPESRAKKTKRVFKQKERPNSPAPPLPRTTREYQRHLRERHRCSPFINSTRRVCSTAPAPAPAPAPSSRGTQRRSTPVLIKDLQGLQVLF
jgi:hypothetical protein